MAKDTVKSNSINLLDTINPMVMVTAGQGAAGYLYEIDDYCAATAAGTATLASTYRLVRFPTQVKIKSVQIYSDGILDSSATASLAIDFNIAFSDSTIDGTPSNLQGLIPTTAFGGATTPVGTYSSPNIMFGTNKPTTNAVWTPTDITLKGSTSFYTIANVMDQPLWQTFGFTATSGQNQDPGGNFDILAYVSTVAGTAGSGNLGCKVTYIR
jgi:hypothetical protein